MFAHLSGGYYNIIYSKEMPKDRAGDATILGAWEDDAAMANPAVIFMTWQIPLKDNIIVITIIITIIIVIAVIIITIIIIIIITIVIIIMLSIITLTLVGGFNPSEKILVSLDYLL